MDNLATFWLARKNDLIKKKALPKCSGWRLFYLAINFADLFMATMRLGT
jgi:hypothetical protein